MRHREEILDHLYEILSRNYFDGKIYSHAAESCKRLSFKNFFRKLSHQKKTFCKRIKYEIQVLQHEIVLMGGELSSVKRKWKDHELSILPVFRHERDGLIKECYRREKESIELYKKLLSKISLGHLREMLLFQKHSVQLILNEIETMGLKAYDERENEKSQGGKTSRI